MNAGPSRNCWRGGLDWKAISLTPKDMDFLDAKHNAAREIALCLPVATADAFRHSLRRVTRLRQLSGSQPRIHGAITDTAAGIACGRGFVAMAGAGLWRARLRLSIDSDRVRLLSSDRTALWDAALLRRRSLTLNEKRIAVGLCAGGGWGYLLAPALARGEGGVIRGSFPGEELSGIPEMPLH